MGELIVNGLKIALIVSISTVFMSAIVTLFNAISAVVFGSIVGEILGVVSMCLPFNALSVFKAVWTSANIILSFFTAKKVFYLLRYFVQL